MSLLSELLEGGSGSGRPDDGSRSRCTLWFSRRENWLADLRRTYGANVDILTSEGENSNIYATDAQHKWCYGVWYNRDDKGTTFYKSKPMTAVGAPKVGLKQKFFSPPHRRGI